MRVRLDYGRTGLDVVLPAERTAPPLVIQNRAPLEDPEAVVAALLENPTGTPPLRELARGKKRVCILICDITRPVPNPVLLRPILKVLEDVGIPHDAIMILVATGLHRPSTPEERLEMVGPEIVARYRIEDHYGTRLDEHVFLGETPRGVPAWIDRRYVEADLKITTGLIEPHLMAGYSGGRKLICPGIAALETVQRWHSPQFLEHPRADCGFLEGNPVHEENTRIARMAGCDFIVNVVIDHKRSVTAVVAGDMEKAFLEGVKFVEEVVTVRVDRPFDVVVTSSAGYPLDTTFYQTIKGMTGCLPIVKEGGTIIIAAGLSEGLGSPEFQSLFHENASLEEFMQKILGKTYFVMDQWQLEELAKVRRKARVKIVSDGIPAHILEKCFVEPAPSVEAAVAASLADYGPDARIAVIPKGPYVLPTLAPAPTPTPTP